MTFAASLLRAWPAWRDAPASLRAACLERFAAELARERERLASVIALEVGKPLWEARGEVDAMIGKVGITLGQGLELVAERSFEAGDGQQARWRNRARGALAVLGPFNFPAHLPNGHIVPALLAGNTIVFKPSELTPAAGALMIECWEAANLPPEAPFTLTVFPREETLPELLYNRLTGADRERDAGGISSTSIEHSLKAVQPLLQRLEAVLDSPGVLTMPPLGPIR